jgi:hypothetical protein
LVRLPGIAPRLPPWRGDILLLNHNREIKRAGSARAPGPCHFNKEQTPLGDLPDPNPRFHGGCFSVWGHTSSEALKIKLQKSFRFSRRAISRSRAHRIGDDSMLVLAKFNLSPEDIIEMSRYSCSQTIHLSLTAFHIASSAGKTKTLPTFP